MGPEVDGGRRQVLGAGITIAAAGFLGGAATKGQPAAGTTPSTSPFGAAFPPLRRVDAGALSVAYLELGPPSGRPVLLLHGWPYDIHAFAEAGPLIAAQGLRVIIPHLRGYGATRFRSADA